MTISLKLSVNGDYVATAKHNIDGEEAQTVVVQGSTDGSGPVEEHLHFRHGAVNIFEITEEHGPEYRERIAKENGDDSPARNETSED